MSDTESETEVIENVKQPLETKSVNRKVKPRAQMTEERLQQLAQMRERAKIIAQAKKELKADNPSVKEYKRRDPVLMKKVEEIEQRGSQPHKAKVDKPNVTANTTVVPDAQGAPLVKPNAQKAKKNKKIVYVTESDSSSSEEEVVIKKPRAKKQYQWTPEDIEDLKNKELEMRLKKYEEQNEFALMENAMLKKRYNEKVKQVQKEQLAKFMFGGK